MFVSMCLGSFDQSELF